MRNASKFAHELRERLISRECDYGELISIAPELSLSWLSKFASGARDNPTVKTLDHLQRALDELDSRRKAA